MEYNVGDKVELKKEHPCGNRIWTIMRIGVDFKLKCEGCAHEIIIERQKATKMIRRKL